MHEKDYEKDKKQMQTRFKTLRRNLYNYNYYKFYYIYISQQTKE